MKPEEHTSDETQAGTGMQGLKILVAEDIPLNQLLLKALLDEFGSTYDFAENGKIAVEKLKENKYDLVLMDLQMPVMDGFDAASEIRNTLRSEIPIIALTADIKSDDVKKAKASGMNDYIEKPIDEKLLYAKVIKALKKPISTEEAMQLLKQEEENTAPQPLEEHAINLSYLRQRTKDNPELMKEMIRQYLKQTPVLINTMRDSIAKRDWDELYDAIHKMIPSFWIMGINTDFEYMAKTIKDSAENEENLEKIPELFKKIELVCTKACSELKAELAV